MDYSQTQTKDTFAFKWKKRETYEGDNVRVKAYNWLLERYFGGEQERQMFVDRCRDKSFLDAGCGSGFSSSVLFHSEINRMKYSGVDISDAVTVAKKRFTELGLKGDFVRDNITTMKLGKEFDIIFSEGVLHHTSEPFAAFLNLVAHLAENGLIMFYVYRKKTPIREFSDDLIREKIKKLGDEEAWKELMPLTKLGKILGDLDIHLEIEEDIDLLGIPKGTHDLQRLFYYYFFKAYYDKNYSLEEMNHINFDWYRPLNCFRFTPAEIRQWLKTTDLKELRFQVEDSGITVVAQKL